MCADFSATGSQTAMDSTDTHDGRRRKVFNPLKSLKKLFTSGSARRHDDHPEDASEFGSVAQGLKAKSTTDMIGVVTRSDDDTLDAESAAAQPAAAARKQLSLSADSVFSGAAERPPRGPDPPAAAAERPPRGPDPPAALRASLVARSSESIASGPPSAQAVGPDSGPALSPGGGLHSQRCPDEDEGHPRSPLALATTADVISADVIPDSTGRLDKWSSLDSGHSVLSGDGSYNDQEEDFFKEKWQTAARPAQQAGGDGSTAEESRPASLDLNLVRRHASLNSAAAIHRLAVKPRNKRIASVHQHKVHAALQKPVEIIVQIPLQLQDESAPSVVDDDPTKAEEIAKSRSLAAEAAKRVMKKTDAHDSTAVRDEPTSQVLTSTVIPTSSSPLPARTAAPLSSVPNILMMPPTGPPPVTSASTPPLKKDLVVRRPPKTSTISTDESNSRRQTVSIPSDALPLSDAKLKRSSMHGADNPSEKLASSPETIESEFSQMFQKFGRRKAGQGLPAGDRADSEVRATDVVSSRQTVPTRLISEVIAKSADPRTWTTSKVGADKPIDVKTVNLKIEQKQEKTAKTDEKSDTSSAVRNVKVSGPLSGRNENSSTEMHDAKAASAKPEGVSAVSVTRRSSSRVYGAKQNIIATTHSEQSPEGAKLNLLTKASSEHSPEGTKRNNASDALKLMHPPSAVLSKVSPRNCDENFKHDPPGSLPLKHTSVHSATIQARNATSENEKEPNDSQSAVKSTTKVDATSGTSEIRAVLRAVSRSSSIKSPGSKPADVGGTSQNILHKKCSPEVTPLSDRNSPRDGGSSASGALLGIKKSYSISYKATPLKENSAASEASQSKVRSISQSEPPVSPSTASLPKDIPANTFHTSIVSSAKSAELRIQPTLGEKLIGSTQKDRQSISRSIPALTKTGNSPPASVVNTSNRKADGDVKPSNISRAALVSDTLPVPTAAVVSRDNTKMSKSLDTAEFTAKLKSAAAVPAVSNVNVAGDYKSKPNSVIDANEQPAVILLSSLKSTAVAASPGGMKTRPLRISPDEIAESAEPAWFAMARRKTKDWSQE